MIRYHPLCLVAAALAAGAVAILGANPALGSGGAAEPGDWLSYSNGKARMSFEYPKGWKVEDEGFHTTASRARASVPSLTLFREGGEEDSDNWIRINPRQFQDEDGRCVDAAHHRICT